MGGTLLQRLRSTKNSRTEDYLVFLNYIVTFNHYFFTPASAAFQSSFVFLFFGKKSEIVFMRLSFNGELRPGFSIPTLFTSFATR